MERYSNQHRTPHPSFKKNDQVWLSLRNIPTDRAQKKLDWRTAPYKILKVLGSYTYKLNTLLGIHPIFHASLLRPKAIDPFPS